VDAPVFRDMLYTRSIIQAVYGVLGVENKAIRYRCSILAAYKVPVHLSTRVAIHDYISEYDTLS
jgi:hypothetical protein